MKLVIKGILRQKKFVSSNYHILDSKGVLYSSFWLDGSENPRNLKKRTQNLSPGVSRGSKHGV